MAASILRPRTLAISARRVRAGNFLYVAVEELDIGGARVGRVLNRVSPAGTAQILRAAEPRGCRRRSL